MIPVNALVGCVCGFLMILVFLLGYILGRLTRAPAAMLPVEPTLPDEFKRMQYEADQKAFTDCMNYSADVAYGGPEDERLR